MFNLLTLLFAVQNRLEEMEARLSRLPAGDEHYLLNSLSEGVQEEEYKMLYDMECKLHARYGTSWTTRKLSKKHQTVLLSMLRNARGVRRNAVCSAM